MRALNREALSLYRDVIRASRMFTWPNEKGELWGEVLRMNARKEFEQARFEKDPILVARLITVGRDSIVQITDKVAQQAQKMQSQIDQSRTDK